MPDPTISVASAAPAKAPLTKEQKAKRFAELRQRMGRSLLKVDLAPAGRTPYWARKDDANELARLEALGFSIVHDSDPKALLWKAPGRREDGTFVVGDVILMSIESDLYEEYLAYNAELQTKMISAGAEDFKEQARQRDVPVFETSGRK
jgi:hypothetical protein